MDGGAKPSPDGTQLAFYSDRAGRFEIFVVGADGHGLERLTAGSEGLWEP